jgi:hypothetical protein
MREKKKDILSKRVTPEKYAESPPWIIKSYIAYKKLKISSE